MGFERHNEFAVRFKFRELETCTTCYSPQIFHLDTSGYFYAILPCKIAADGEAILSFISNYSVRRPQISGLGTAMQLLWNFALRKLEADGK